MHNTLILTADPYSNFEAGLMEFKLTYEGLLLGATRVDTRAPHKHQIRKVFHKQLKRFWETNRFLQGWINADIQPHIHMRDHLSQQFQRNGYNFVPLVTENLSLFCDIHILILRPDVPGSLISSGDIDNRLKTVFDALRLPDNQGELGGINAPEVEETPFFCLLEDDRLISKIAVETDILLEPTGAKWNDNDVRMIITVRLRPYIITWGNINFG
jgi:hypothetical protein